MKPLASLALVQGAVSRAPFVGESERVPTNFASLQPTSSQPSASHSSGSSSVENSSRPGGAAAYAIAALTPGEAAINRSSRTRSRGARPATRGRMSSAVIGLAIGRFYQTPALTGRQEAKPRGYPQATLGSLCGIRRSFETAVPLKGLGSTSSVISQSLFSELGKQVLGFGEGLGPALCGRQLLKHDSSYADGEWPSSLIATELLTSRPVIAANT